MAKKRQRKDRQPVEPDKGIRGKLPATRSADAER
jgi:hypothetical protein